MSNVLVLEQPWEIKINIVDITSWFVQTTTHNEKLPGSLAFDEMKRMSCYLLLKVNKFAKIHKLNNSHFDSMYNHKLLSHAFRTWSELKNGPDKPTFQKKKSRIYVICFLSIVLLCVIASGLSKRIKSLFRLTTHLLILLFTTVFPVLDTCTFSYSIQFFREIIQSFAATLCLQTSGSCKFFSPIFLKLYWLPIFCFTIFQK